MARLVCRLPACCSVLAVRLEKIRNCTTRSSRTGTGFPSFIAGSNFAVRIASTAFSSSPKPIGRATADLSGLSVSANHDVIKRHSSHTVVLRVLIRFGLKFRYQLRLLVHHVLAQHRWIRRSVVRLGCSRLVIQLPEIRHSRNHALVNRIGENAVESAAQRSGRLRRRSCRGRSIWIRRLVGGRISSSFGLGFLDCVSGCQLIVRALSSLSVL